MASKAGDVGKEGSRDLRQRKLVTEDKSNGKRVSFRLEETENVSKVAWQKEIEKLKKYWQNEVKELKQMIADLKTEVKLVRSREEKRNDKLEQVAKSVESMEKWKEEVRNAGDVEMYNKEDSDSGGGSRASVRSFGSSVRSIRSYGSEGFSDREVNKLKRWMSVREREERSNNIVIRGLGEGIEEFGKAEDKKAWTENFIGKKLDVNCKVVMCRLSGSVVIAKIDGEEKKKEIMIKKSKLKGGKIFIENDLTWEERRVQEKIHKWCREQREKGFEIKIGTGRVKIGDSWKRWEEIEENTRKEGDKGGMNEENREKRRDRERDKSQDFN
ncbi:uncharacterized protein LOC113005092 [Solenopsis invicta]|uniref:uncharacterized protein LOC113005092 n=1 Tax=Solenopsis invicta TaxID=13686 RepID=UPI00193CF0FA|nr:uncharacterized protein LOC113005092 [Solenopsis invicta]